MFGKKVEKVKVKEEAIEEKDIAIRLNIELKGQKKEEHELAESLGLTKQGGIIKLESLGFTCIRRADFKRLLDVEPKTALTVYPLNTFDGKIPVDAMREIQKIQKDSIFDNLYIVAPSDKSSMNPLLVGEKFTQDDRRDLEGYEGCYPKEFGKRHYNFFERDSIIMLIMNWKANI